MYRFYVTIGHHYKQYYNINIPPNGKMDLVQAIDSLYGTLGQSYPNQVATIQFISLTILLKK